MLIGCGVEDTDTTTTISSINSPANLRYEGLVVEWDAVTNAESYQIKIDEEIIDVTGTTYSFDSDSYGMFVVSVRVVNQEIYSEFSNTLSVTIIKELSSPTNIVQNGTLVSWSSVEGATGYVVKYNSVEYYTTITQLNITVDSPTNVEVMAVGSETDYILDSDYSSPVLYSITLNSPENINYQNGILYWDSVLLASGYYLTINDGTPITVTRIQYDLNYSYVGQIEVAVKAFSNTAGYIDSAEQELSVTCPALNLITPTNIEITEGILSFTSVDYADNYDIFVSGVYYTTIENNSYNIPSSVSSIADSYIQVRSASDIHVDSDLSGLLYVNTNIITTVEELQNMSQFGNYELANNINITSEWTPISFSGVLDGNGFDINGILITSTNENIGLFSILNSAVIENLTVSGSFTLSTDELAANIGGLAGTVINSQISNCHIAIDIIATSNNGVGNLGGVFGRIESVEISSVTYTGTINATHFATGGFAGRANNSDSVSTIHQAKVDVDILVTGGEQAYTGGFIGFLANNSMSITESIALVDLVGPVYVGGFIGYLGSGHITDCYASGNVTASTNALVHLGGFIGRVEGYNVTITDCLSMMIITTGTATEYTSFGGFSGSTPGGAYGNIYQNCYYDSSLTELPASGNDGVTNGITSLPTVDLVSISTFDEDIWDLTGSLPILGWETE
jgi:hypothetical protein